MTEAGKVIASRNAITHGGYSQSVYLRNDDEALEFSRLVEGYSATFAPEGTWENNQVEKLAVVDWTMRRVEAWIQRELKRRRIRYKQSSGDMASEFLPEVDFEAPLPSSFEGFESECLHLTAHTRQLSEKRTEYDSERTSTVTRYEVDLRSILSNCQRIMSALQRQHDRVLQQLLAVKSWRKKDSESDT